MAVRSWIGSMMLVLEAAGPDSDGTIAGHETRVLRLAAFRPTFGTAIGLHTNR